MDAIGTVLARLPAGIVTDDPHIVAGYTTDFRGVYAGSARAVLRPRNVAEVQAIVRTCGELHVPLVPQGGNTSYCTAATPSREGNELVLSLERMNQIREVDRANLSMCAEAGAILSELQDAAAKADLLLPLSLGSQQSCRIGGNLSTNAGGISVLRYGMARDLVLGLEVVLPDGSLYSELSPLRKNNTGYDVKQLFVGAEGTLGVITAASLKLTRKPQQSVTAFLLLQNIGDLDEVLERAQIQSGEAVTSFEYISVTSLQLLLSANPNLRHPVETTGDHYVLLEVATASPTLNFNEVVTQLLTELMQQGLIVDGSIASSGQQATEFWHLRENIPEAEVSHGGSVKHDIAVRTSRVAAFIEAASALVRRASPGSILSVYGHVGDGNVHFNVLAAPGVEPQGFKQQFEKDVSPQIYDLAARMEGTFSAEYGIGRVKLKLLEQYGAPGKAKLIRRVKLAFDPAGLLNPGKVVNV